MSLHWIWSSFSDYSTFLGEGTKFGLKEELEQKWRKQKELESFGDFASTSQISYKYDMCILKSLFI